MPRRRIPDGVIANIVALAAAGERLDSIYDELLDTFSDGAPDRRTVARYLKMWKELDEDTKALDKPWKWPHMPEGVPFEASRFLFDCELDFEEGRRRSSLLMDVHTESSEPNDTYSIPTTDSDSDHGVFTLTTNRDVVWRWRVRLADPDLSLSDLCWLASQFVWRERKAVLRRQPDMDDLTAKLIYRPWKDAQHYSRYYDALDSGQAPYPRSDLEDWLSLLQATHPVMHNIDVPGLREMLQRLERKYLDNDVAEALKVAGFGLSFSQDCEFKMKIRNAFQGAPVAATPWTSIGAAMGLFYTMLEGTDNATDSGSMVAGKHRRPEGSKPRYSGT